MKRTLCAVAVVAAALVGPAVAVAKVPTRSHVRTYLHLYRQAARQLGRRAPGRNIVKDGTARGPATDAQVVASIGTLQRMLAPAPARQSIGTAVYDPSPSSPPVTLPEQPAVTAAPAMPTYSSGSVPACASESGTNYSTGPANTNPSSGATGRYQILPSTAAGYGCDLSTPGGQDACAATIYAHQGAGAWVGCGG